MSIDIDMQEIHAVFFEESFEGVDVMEEGLLGLNPGAADTEIVNDIFRAAHSIKGGAATFGFTDVSGFTHGVETLLDQVRAGDRPVSEPLIELLLNSVDCIKGMLEALKNGQPVNSDEASGLQRQIDAMLAEDAPDSGAGDAGDDATASDASRGDGWRIKFKPHDSVFKTSNDPARIFRELRELGELDVRSDISALPAPDALNPELCCSSWTLQLKSGVEKKAVEEVFEWVSGQCELTIQPLGAADDAGAPEADSADEPETATVAAIADAAPATPTATKEKTAAAPKDSGSIRVSIDKIDSLLNLVGELVITQSILARYGDQEVAEEDKQGLRDGLLVLERHTRELQESAMQIRMLPIGSSFARFKRLVRDISNKLGKKVELKLSGENTELDKTVLEKISDPLVHLVRNSLDHGIEMPEERIAAGKDETGILHLSAYHEGGNIVIQIEDDGAGLNRHKILGKAIERGIISASDQLTDEQIHNLIFQPGFSTAEAVSDLSGRGVGMDVVRRNISDLGGRIEVTSTEGQGSKFKVRLPLTLAILDGQLVSVGDDVYIFSLLSIVETVLVSREDVNKVFAKGNVYRLRDEYIPVVRLREVFDLHTDGTPKTYLERNGELLVVVESDGQQIGLFVDELLDQQQIVIKSLEENYKPVSGLAGATILGDGSVALIVDVPGLLQELCADNKQALKQNTAA